MGNVRDLWRDALLLGHEECLVGDCLLLDSSLVRGLIDSLILNGIADMRGEPAARPDLGGL